MPVHAKTMCIFDRNGMSILKQVKIQLVGTSTNWTVTNAPKTTTANTPDFVFDLSSAGSAGPIANPTWTATVNITI